MKTTIDRLKVVLGIKDDKQDDLLLILLDDARDFILSHTRRNEEQWLPVFDSIRRQIAVINYNRQGAEGSQGKSVGEVSDTFYVLGADYPDSIIKTLNQYRLAVVR